MKMLWGPVSPVLASILSVAVTSVFFCIGEILLLVNILRVFLVIKVGLQSSWKAHCLCKCSLFFIYQKRSVKFPSSRSPSTTWITRCPREWWSSLSWSSTLLSTWPEVVFLIIKIDVLLLFTNVFFISLIILVFHISPRVYLRSGFCESWLVRISHTSQHPNSTKWSESKVKRIRNV